MAKMRISDLNITHREVEVPDKCPACGADFTKLEEGNLREANYADAYYSGSVADLDGERIFEADGGRRVSYGDTFIVVGYDCANCFFPLGTGEENCVDGSTRADTKTVGTDSSGDGS